MGRFLGLHYLAHLHSHLHFGLVAGLTSDEVLSGRKFAVAPNLAARTVSRGRAKLRARLLHQSGLLGLIVSVIEAPAEFEPSTPIVIRILCRPKRKDLSHTLYPSGAE